MHYDYSSRDETGNCFYSIPPRQAPVLPQHSSTGDGHPRENDPTAHRARLYLQVLLDVLAVVGDPAGGDAGLPHQLKADLPAQVVGNLPFLQTGHSQRAVSRTTPTAPRAPRLGPWTCSHEHALQNDK